MGADQRADAFLGQQLQAQLGLVPGQRAGTTDRIPAVPFCEDRLDGFGRAEPGSGFGDIELSIGPGGEDG